MLYLVINLSNMKLIMTRLKSRNLRIQVRHITFQTQKIKVESPRVHIIVTEIQQVSEYPQV